ncbi:hypothetical protein ACQP1O_37905 [Nocardia sp. CA-151230]
MIEQAALYTPHMRSGSKPMTVVGAARVSEASLVNEEEGTWLLQRLP